MLRELKDWIKLLLGIAILLVAYQGIRYVQKRNSGEDKIIVVENQALKKIDKDEEKYVPKDATVHGKIDIETKSEDPSKKKETSVIVHTDGKCLTCTPKVTTITKLKNYYGFTNEPKFFLGVIGEDVTIGYAHSVLRFNKVTLDALAGVPLLGLGAGYQITNNSFLGLGAGIKYLNYESITKVSSYNVSIEIPLKVNPIGYIGFRF